MKKYIIQSSIMSLCLVLAACQQGWHGMSSNPSAKQTIDMNLSDSDTSWNVVKKTNDDKGGTTVTMMPRGQNSSNWKEGIRTTTIFYRYNAGITAQNFVQNEMMRAKKYCAQVDSNVIAQTNQFTTYQLNISQCAGGFPDQIIIGKAFNGSDAVYTVRYSAKMGLVSQPEIDSMSNIVKESQLVPNG